MTKNIRSFVSVLFLSCVVLGLAGCDDVEVKFERTSQTPNVNYIEKSIDLYEKDCKHEQEYGEHHSCGAPEWEKVCRREHGREFCRERDVYPSCSYTKVTCTQVPAGKATAKVKVIFDSRADLRSGEVEKFKAALQYRQGQFIIRPSVISAKHRYKYPSSIKFSPRQVAVLKFELR